MYKQITRILHTQPSNVMEDLIGVLAIFVVVFVGLSLPVLA